MLRVRKDLCVGCGLCTKSCPREAILVQSGQVQIDQARCNGCGICLDVCPRKAIIELVPVSQDELEATVSSLKQRANKLVVRIESLKRRGKVSL